MFLTKKQNRILSINLILLLSSVVSVAVALVYPTIFTGALSVLLIISGLFCHLIYANRIYVKIRQEKLDGDIKAELQRVNAWGDKVTEWDGE